MKTITARKHFFSPRPLFLFPEIGSYYVYGRIMFHDLSKYTTHRAENQLDWNKGGGVSFGVIPNRNAAMIAWRWSPLYGFQMQPYLNIDGQNIHKNFEPVFIEQDKAVLWSIEYSKESGFILFEINGNQWLYNCDKWGLITFPRFPYFGGDDTPVRPVSIDWWSSNVNI